MNKQTKEKLSLWQNIWQKQVHEGKTFFAHGFRGHSPSWHGRWGVPDHSGGNMGALASHLVESGSKEQTETGLSYEISRPTYPQ